MLRFDIIGRARSGIVLIEVAVLAGLAVLGVATVIMITAQSNAVKPVSTAAESPQIPADVMAGVK